MKEIGRSLHRHDRVVASLEGILGRIRIEELLSGRCARRQFNPSVRYVPFEGAHTIDQAFRETDRIVQHRLVDVREMTILEVTRVYDALVRVVRYRQT